MSRDYCIGWKHYFRCKRGDLKDIKTVLTVFHNAFKNFRPTQAEIYWTTLQQMMVSSFAEICTALDKIFEDNPDEKMFELGASIFSKHTIIRSTSESGDNIFIMARKELSGNKRYKYQYFEINIARKHESFYNYDKFKIALKDLGKKYQKITPTSIDIVYNRKKYLTNASFERIYQELSKIKKSRNECTVTIEIRGKTKINLSQKKKKIYNVIKIGLGQERTKLSFNIEIRNPVFFYDIVSAEQNSIEFNNNYKKFLEETPFELEYFDVDGDWSTVDFFSVIKGGLFDLKKINRLDYNKIKETIKDGSWRKELHGIVLGEYRILKELKVEISKDGIISGFIDMLMFGRIPLEGKINQTKQKRGTLPLRIHYKIKNPLKENETILPEQKTAKEYIKSFYDEKPRILNVSSVIFADPHHIITYPKEYFFLDIFTEQYYKNNMWKQTPDFVMARAYLKDIEILEAQNIPNLMDVKK